MSTKPGVTSSPLASITSRASPSTDGPTSTMTPSCTATSPTNRARPVPSTIVPPVIFRSNTRTIVLHRDAAGRADPERRYRAEVTRTQRITTRVATSEPRFVEYPSPPDGAPNVVMVVLDDVGFAQLSC